MLQKAYQSMLYVMKKPLVKTQSCPAYKKFKNLLTVILENCPKTLVNSKETIVKTAISEKIMTGIREMKIIKIFRAIEINSKVREQNPNQINPPRGETCKCRPCGSKLDT